MSYGDELLAIESRFSATWVKIVNGASVARTPVEYANVRFPMPKQEPWVRLSVLPGAAFLVSMGPTKLYRNPGIIDIGIFNVIGTASKDALALADAAAAIFRGVQFSGISCRAPGIVVLGVLLGWYQITVSVPYHRDELL